MDRVPPQRCAACHAVSTIRILEVFELAGEGLTDLALCLDFVACNRRWGFSGRRHS